MNKDSNEGEKKEGLIGQIVQINEREIHAQVFHYHIWSDMMNSCPGQCASNILEPCMQRKARQIPALQAFLW